MVPCPAFLSCWHLFNNRFCSAPLPAEKGTGSPHDRTTTTRSCRSWHSMELLISWGAALRSPFHCGRGLVVFKQHHQSFSFSPARGGSGAVVCCGIGRLDDPFPHGSCCGLAAICQSHFCIWLIPMDTSSCRACLEYIKFHFFPLLAIAVMCQCLQGSFHCDVPARGKEELELWMHPTKLCFHLPCDW